MNGVNPWNLVSKYEITRCCRRCRKWKVQRLGDSYTSYQTYDTWAKALDDVIRMQSRQFMPYAAFKFGGAA